MKRAALIAAATALLGVPAQAYYHYVHYLTRTGPFTPVYQKFDLSALPGGSNTVTIFVSDQGPANYGPNDSFGSVLSQVKMAIQAWNTAPNSDLHLAFGGLETPNQTSNTAGIDVTFTDLQPGVLGLTLVTPSSTPKGDASGNQFFPIQRSLVMLTRDTSRAPGPSYLEGFYTTAVHELGHALGLQHTFTSTAMSQGIIRNTSRTRPLDADDYAALSILYGKAGWNANLGSISGRVTTTSGTGVGMASVVAIVPNGPAISTLTNPDGTYRIEGLQPNSYLLYVHPLPPDHLIQLPMDPAGQPIPQNVPFFQTEFYPGTLDLTAAQNAAIQITPGAAITGKDFQVQVRSSATTYDVTTYTWLDPATRTYGVTGTPVTPAFMNALQPLGGFVAQAVAPAPTPTPQWVALLGGFGLGGIRAYGTPTALQFGFNVPVFTNNGPRHLVMNFGDDLYVLPQAVNLVQKGPPSVSAVTPNGDGTVTIAGAGLGLDSAIYFDGLPAAVTAAFNGSDAQGSITVAPPPGASGQTATVTVYNADGQNSMLLQAQNPPTYHYDSAGAPQISVFPSALPVGAGAMVDITAANMKFVEGQVTVGFGSDDVLVRRVWVLSPTHLVANVTVSPTAAIGTSEISVISGFQIAQVTPGFQVQPADPRLPLVALPVVNAAPGQQTIYPGATATVYGSNLAPVPGAYQITLNDQQVQVQFAGANQVNFVVPANAAVGPQVLKINNGQQTASVYVQIAAQPPAIQSFTNISGVAVTQAAPGDTVVAVVTGLDPSVPGNLSRLRVTIGGVDMIVQQATSLGGNQFGIQFIVTQGFGGAQVPVAVIVDGSSSAPASLTVR